VNLTPKGKIGVPTPGTPVPIETAAFLTAAAKIHVQTAPANTGKTYLGTPTLNKSTLAGVVHVFAPAAAPFEAIDLESHADDDCLQLAQYAIDADVAGEGLTVSYWVE